MVLARDVTVFLGRRSSPGSRGRIHHHRLIEELGRFGKSNRKIAEHFKSLCFRLKDRAAVVKKFLRPAIGLDVSFPSDLWFRPGVLHRSLVSDDCKEAI
jgi:hypothetical protein